MKRRNFLIGGAAAALGAASVKQAEAAQVDSPRPVTTDPFELLSCEIKEALPDVSVLTVPHPHRPEAVLLVTSRGTKHRCNVDLVDASDPESRRDIVEKFRVYVLHHNIRHWSIITDA